MWYFLKQLFQLARGLINEVIVIISTILRGPAPFDKPRKDDCDFVCVFIHGLWGSKSSFVKIAEHIYDQYNTNIEFFSYNPFLSMNAIISQLKETCQAYIDKKKIVFICHSYGGIVGKEFVSTHMKDIDKSLKVNYPIICIASPLLGAYALDFWRWINSLCNPFRFTWITSTFQYLEKTYGFNDIIEFIDNTKKTITDDFSIINILGSLDFITGSYDDKLCSESGSPVKQVCINGANHQGVLHHQDIASTVSEYLPPCSTIQDQYTQPL